ncbi:MAG: hypothetical protein ACE5IQ_06885 [Candidatus Methylomirabilales bacterium]
MVKHLKRKGRLALDFIVTGTQGNVMLGPMQRCARGGWGFHLFTALTILVTLVTWRSHPIAWANGGTPQLTAVRTGPYLVSVWTQPDPPRTGLLHVSVAVMEPQSRKPVLDAEVRMTVERTEGQGRSIRTTASRGGGPNKLLYHASLDLPEEGGWRVNLEIDGPQGTGRAGFELQAEGSSPIWLISVVGIGLIVAVLTWLVARWRVRFSSG